MKSDAFERAKQRAAKDLESYDDAEPIFLKLQQRERMGEEYIRSHSPVQVSFNGAVIVHPAKVYVSKKQADTAVKNIRRFLKEHGD